MKNLIIVAGTLVVFAGMGFAQQSNTNNPPAAPAAVQTPDNQSQVKTAPPAEIQKDKAEVKKDVKEIQGDKQKLADINKLEQADRKDLNAKEKAAVDAVKTDAALTPAQKAAKISALRKDFNAQRKAVTEKYQAERKAAKSEINKDRKDIHADRKDLHKDRHETKRENHEKKR